MVRLSPQRNSSTTGIGAQPPAIGCDRLLADDELGPLFAQTHMPVQRAAMATYLAALCSGTATGASERLRAATPSTT